MKPKAPVAQTVAIVVTSPVTARLFVLGFAESLCAMGHEVHVISNQADSLAAKVRHSRVRFHGVQMLRDPSPLRDIRALVQLTRVLSKIRPDVLTYATPKASLLAAIAGVLARVPVRVYQIWGLRLETVRGARRTVLGALERLTAVCSTQRLANSRSLARRYRDLRLSCGREVDVLGEGSSHGVDLERFSRTAVFGDVDADTRDYLRTHDGIVVGFVGRLHVDKGVSTLLEAVQELHRRGVPLRTIFVGANEGEAASLVSMPNVHSVGAVDDPRPYYGIMDLLVLMSRREGFPNVVLEAAAMSVPAVVSTGTGVVDSVLDSRTGVIVPVDDSAALARVLERLAGNEGERIRMGASAREWVEQKFDQASVWKALSRYCGLGDG